MAEFYFRHYGKSHLSASYVPVSSSSDPRLPKKNKPMWDPNVNPALIMKMNLLKKFSLLPMKYLNFKGVRISFNTLTDWNMVNWSSMMNYKSKW